MSVIFGNSSVKDLLPRKPLIAVTRSLSFRIRSTFLPVPVSVCQPFPRELPRRYPQRVDPPPSFSAFLGQVPPRLSSFFASPARVRVDPLP